MANSSNIKVTVGLEGVHEYATQAQRLEAANEKMAQKAARSSINMGRVIQRTANDYKKAITGAGIALVGVHAADTALRAIADTIRNTDFSKMQFSVDKMAQSARDFSMSVLESIPLLGGVAHILEESAYWMTGEQEAAHALAETRKNADAAQAYASHRAKESAIGATVELEKQADAQKKIASDAQKIAGEAKAAEELAANIEADTAQAAIDLMEDIQDQIDERTMSEDELFAKQLLRMNLTEDEEAKLWDLHRALEAVNQVQETATEPDVDTSAQSVADQKQAGSIDTINTAVGGVRMAGMSSGLDKLAQPASQTAANTKAIAANTAKLSKGSEAP